MISRYTYPNYSTWATIANPGTAFPDVDKPWVVAGSDNELYLVYMQTLPSDRKYNLGRSTDGGLTWLFQPVAVSGVTLDGNFCSQPIVLDDGGCYLTVTDVTVLQTRILRYTDEQAMFDFVRDASGAPVAIPQNEINFTGYIAGGYMCKSVPWIAGKVTTAPGAADLVSLFIIRPDLVLTGSDTTDVNLYCRRLQNNGPSGSWQVTATWELRAPDGAVPVSGLYPDQFCHSATIDSFGRLHVAFYDYSSTRAPNGPLTGDYDVWHLMIPQPELTPPSAPYMLATNLRTVLLSEDPPLMLADALKFESPKEYSAIDSYFDPSTNKTVVWCLYAGTSTGDEDTNKTVLFGSRLVIGP